MVIVLKTSEHEKALSILQDMGLVFVQEKHGDGPVHHACELNGHVLEVYPAGSGSQVKIIE